MSKEEVSAPKIVFPDVKALAAYIGVSGRRIRFLKKEGRLEYSTRVVVIDQEELERCMYELEEYRATGIKLRRRRRPYDECGGGGKFGVVLGKRTTQRRYQARANQSAIRTKGS